MVHQIQRTREVKDKIGILEPYEGLRESLNLVLEDYHLTHLVDSVEVLDALRVSRFNLIVIDVDFVWDSLGLIRLIKKKYSPNQKVLLLSKHFELLYQEDAIRIGAGVRFREKPFESRELLEYVQTLVRGFALERHTHILRIHTEAKVSRLDFLAT